MNNLVSKISIWALSLSALVLLCLCVKQNRKQTALQLKIAELQEEIEVFSPQDTTQNMNEHTLSRSRSQKSLARKNDAEYLKIEENLQKGMSWATRPEITIQELAEKDPSAYRNLLRSLHYTIKQLSEKRDELLNLMVSLKPNDLLSEEDIELLQDKLDEEIRMIDANLTFQEPPKSKFMHEKVEDATSFNQRLDNILDRYCSVEAGLSDPDLIRYMNDYQLMTQPPHFFKIIPFLERAHLFP